MAPTRTIPDDAQDRGGEVAIPCEQTDNIESIKSIVESNQRQSEENTRRIEDSISRLLDNQSNFLSKLEAVLIEDRDHKIRIEKLEKNEDILFQKSRDGRDALKDVVDNKIDPLSTWKTALEGKLSTIKWIPIVCLIITTVMAILSFMSRYGLFAAPVSAG